MNLSSFKLPDAAKLGLPTRTLAKREKLMLGITGGLVLLVGLWFLLLAGDPRTTDDLNREHDKVSNQLREQQLVLNKAKDDTKRQADWQRRSLPANPIVAKSVYQNWLQDLAGRAKLKAAKISNTEAGSRREQFEKFAFTLKATADIENIVAFLYGFYDVGYLHQIRSLDIKPLPQTHNLEVTFGIDVLSLPGAIAKDKLPTEPGHGLRLKTLVEYSKPIVARNLFAPYTPRIVDRPIVEIKDDKTKPPEIKTIDPAERAFVTGFTEVDGVPQVWLMDRMANKSMTLQVGETFRVGTHSGVVKSITSEGAAVIEYNNTKRLLHDGDTLRGGVEVKDVGKSSATLDKVGTSKTNRVD